MDFDNKVYNFKNNRSYSEAKSMVLAEFEQGFTSDGACVWSDQFFLQRHSMRFEETQQFGIA